MDGRLYAKTTVVTVPETEVRHGEGVLIRETEQTTTIYADGIL